MSSTVIGEKELKLGKPTDLRVGDEGSCILCAAKGRGNY